jgi:hypothetical protein
MMIIYTVIATKTIDDNVINCFRDVIVNDDNVSNDNRGATSTLSRTRRIDY